jgi:hypothetical protein
LYLTHIACRGSGWFYMNWLMLLLTCAYYYYSSSVNTTTTNNNSSFARYVTLYMNPDTMKVQKTMFIQHSMSAVGKLCPNQRRVPQLVSFFSSVTPHKASTTTTTTDTHKTKNRGHWLQR